MLFVRSKKPRGVNVKLLVFSAANHWLLISTTGVGEVRTQLNETYKQKVHRHSKQPVPEEKMILPLAAAGTLCEGSISSEILFCCILKVCCCQMSVCAGVAVSELILN